MIVICSKEDDEHAVAVGAILESEHSEEVFVFDTSKYPTSIVLSAIFEDGRRELSLRAPGDRTVSLQEVTSFWWRRPQPATIDSRIQDPEARNFAYHECISALYGLMECCEALWVNDIHRDNAADYKPYQLKVAADLGFIVPTTLITNDPAEALEFWREHDRAVIYKAFNQRGLIWCPTRLMSDEQLSIIDNVRHAPVIFQSLVHGVRDVRVTAIGETVFATEFDIEQHGSPDYRVDMASLPCREHELPPEMMELIVAFMDELGLEYGGIDFRLTADGEYVFFEINTAGEFMYLQQRTHQPIAEAMASHLANGSSSRKSSRKQRPEPPPEVEP